MVTGRTTNMNKKEAITKYLIEHPEAEHREIAESVGVYVQYVSKVIKELKAKGKIKRLWRMKE